MSIETEQELVVATKAALDKAAEIVRGRAWGADKGRPRIYMDLCMDLRKDVTAYFYFPDYPDGSDRLLGGAAVNLYVKDCGQHKNWYKGQQKLLHPRLWRPSLALCALAADDEQLARDIMDGDDTITADLLDSVSHELINGRTNEARKLLFGDI